MGVGGGRGVSVGGGIGVLVGGNGVLVGGRDVAVGGKGVRVGSSFPPPLLRRVLVDVGMTGLRVLVGVVVDVDVGVYVYVGDGSVRVGVIVGSGVSLRRSPRSNAVSVSLGTQHSLVES